MIQSYRRFLFCCSYSNCTLCAHDDYKKYDRLHVLVNTTTNVRFSVNFFLSTSKISSLIMNLTHLKRHFVIEYFTIKFFLQNYFLSQKFTSKKLSLPPFWEWNTYIFYFLIMNNFLHQWLNISLQWIICY